MKLFLGLKKYIFKIFIVVVTLFLNVIGVLLIPRITVDIIDIGVVNGDIAYIINKGLLMLLIAFLSSIFMIISVKQSTDVSTSFAADLREKMFKKVQDLSINQYEKFGAASLIVRSTDDISQLQNLTRIGLRMMLRAPLMFIGAIIMALSTNLQLSTVFVVSLPITLIGISLFTFKMIPISKKVRDKLDNINKVFRQRLSGIRVIRAFDREIYEEENFSQANKDYTYLFKKSGEYSAIFSPFVGFVMNMTLVAILYFGSNLIIKESMMVGDLIGFIQYANNIMHSFLFISMIIIQIPRAQASLDRINDVIDLQVDNSQRGSEILKDIESIEFRNVSFRYPDSNADSLSNVSFKAKRGEIIGIIGSTGSGKTTLANLLVRFYDVTSGQILINGRDIKEYEIHSLRDKIGYTEQKPSLIAGTISENVMMGMEPRVDIDVMTALDIAQADFVLERDEGAEATVTQRGGNFSGGQKQRISIARAVFKDPSLYLIDDSFSALDYKTEKELRQDLYKEIEDNIMIVITQRAQVAYQSDKIVLLENGKMIGLGSHDQLKESSKEYREILESQDFEAGEVYGS